MILIDILPNVVQRTINHPFGNDFLEAILVIWGMDCYCHHIPSVSLLKPSITHMSSGNSVVCYGTSLSRDHKAIIKVYICSMVSCCQTVEVPGGIDL